MFHKPMTTLAMDDCVTSFRRVEIFGSDVIELFLRHRRRLSKPIQPIVIFTWKTSGLYSKSFTIVNYASVWSAT
jgi:hypothetical protein